MGLRRGLGFASWASRTCHPIGAADGFESREATMSLSVNSSGSNNPFAYLQSLMQQGSSQTTSATQSDPLSELLGSLEQEVSGLSSSSASSASAAATSATPSPF